MNLLIRMLHKRLFLVSITIVFTILSVVISLLWNFELSKIINIVSAGNILQLDIVIKAFTIIVIMALISYISSYISSLTCEYISHDLRMGYARYFSNLSVFEIEQLNTGAELSKLQNEIADVSTYIDGNLFQLFGDFIRFILTFVWLLIINPKLTLLVNLPVFMILIYIFYSSRAISNTTKSSQQAKTQMNKYSDTLLSIFPIMRLYDATPMVISGFCIELDKWKLKTIHAERIRARLMSLSGLLSTIPLILLFFVGGNMTINGIITIGTLYIFLNLSGNISGVMMNMPGYISSFRQFSANMRLLEPKISE